MTDCAIKLIFDVAETFPIGKSENSSLRSGSRSKPGDRDGQRGYAPGEGCSSVSSFDIDPSVDRDIYMPLK